MSFGYGDQLPILKLIVVLLQIIMDVCVLLIISFSAITIENTVAVDHLSLNGNDWTVAIAVGNISGILEFKNK